jgi:hypothetical protein
VVAPPYFGVCACVRTHTPQNKDNSTVTPNERISSKSGLMERKGITRNLKSVIRVLPLIAIIIASVIPAFHISQQITILFVLLWIQAFFIFDCFHVKR